MVGNGRQRRVYLDYHASTPCDPRVVEAMLPFFLEEYGNPSSAIHAFGEAAEKSVMLARRRVAEAIGAQPGEIVFTSGATESNNLAILGSASAAPPGRRKVIASAVEHKSVLKPCGHVAKQGFEFRILPVDRDGLVDLGALAESVDERTFLVSVQAANNEIGTIQPILESVQIAHSVGALVHCDGAQALGRIPIDVGSWGVDLLSLSAHKCYGPKGVGALYVRGGPHSAPLDPLTFGGGQEKALRSGTLNVPGIVGFGRASELAVAELEGESARLSKLRDWFEDRVMSRVTEARRNGAPGRRLAGNSSLTLPGVDAEALIANLRDVAISTGSACTSGAPEPSHVLTAIGLDRTAASSTIRVGIGRFSMEAEIGYAADKIAAAAVRLRELSRVVAG